LHRQCSVEPTAHRNCETQRYGINAPGRTEVARTISDRKLQMPSSSVPLSS
jgi:hypothetical protein